MHEYQSVDMRRIRILQLTKGGILRDPKIVQMYSIEHTNFTKVTHNRTVGLDRERYERDMY